MCSFGQRRSGNFLEEELLFCSCEAFLPFRLCSTCAVGFSPRGNSFGCFATGPSSSSLSRPSSGQESRWGVRYAPGFCVSGGLPPLPLYLGPARGVGVLLDYCLLRVSALSLRQLLRELAKGELLDRSGLFLCRYAPRLAFTIPRRTFDDVGNCGSLRRIATAFYPLVFSDLRIVVLVWIRELVTVGWFSLTMAVFLALAPLPVSGQRSRASSRSLSARERLFRERWRSSDRYRSRRVRSQLRGDRYRFSDRYRSCRDRSRCAWSWSLTATSHIVQHACSLPAGEIGVTASGCTLSQVALVIASGHAGDYLPLLPARGQKSQDGWPDVKHRRVLRRLSLSLLLFLKCRWQFLLRLEALFFFLSSLPSVLQDLARFFFVPVRILFPGSDLRYCGWGCAVCWVWVPLCPSTSAAGAVTFGAATAMPAGAGVCPLLCLVCLVLCSVRWISSLVGVSVARPVVGSTGETCHRWRFPSPVLSSRRPGSSTGLSVFRGSGPGFSSAHFWSLLHWRCLSVVLPASAVDCCLSSLRAGVCSLLWQWRISALVLMVACLPLLRVGGRLRLLHPGCLLHRPVSGQSWPILDFTLGEFPEGLCRFSLA